MLVKPAPGLRVRDPATRRLLPDEGIEVADYDLFWNRLIRDGDVVTDPPADVAKKGADKSEERA